MSSGLSKRICRALKTFSHNRPFHPHVFQPVLLAILFSVTACPGFAATTALLVAPLKYRIDQILIKPAGDVSLEVLADFHSEQNTEIVQMFPTFGDIQVVKVPEGETVRSLIAKYKASGLIEFAEPDHLVQSCATVPDDPRFIDGTLWGLNNYGQYIWTPDADIDAPEGWDFQTSASNIVVAVLDTGIRYTHEDLTSNMWTNPISGEYGYNAFTNNLDPNDDNGHGTLVAGVLGASGSNSLGVCGVAWQVQLMACKCLNNWGSGSDSTVLASLEYAITNGARIINASLDSTEFSESVSNAIVAARDLGIIVVASAGNDTADIDSAPRYPAAYDIDNIISVAFTSYDDTLGLFSNYGATNVDLAAPGDVMFSTSSDADNSYYPEDYPNENLYGTSFAAAYVSGAVALMLEHYPGETYQQIINRLMNSAEPIPALNGKCVTGGRLNLREIFNPSIRLLALPVINSGDPFQLRVAAGPNQTCVVEVSPNLFSWTPVYTNTTSTNGTFSFYFTDDQSTNFASQFYRAYRSP
jgi:subtilisin family serine protease